MAPRRAAVLCSEAAARVGILVASLLLSSDSHSSVPSVLPFSSNDAKFMPFSANPALAAIMQASRREEAEGMRRWLLRVEAAIHEWIVRRCFLDCSEEEAIARCAAYRSLGRGWFIVQLLPQKKFKFWWEEIAQIEGKRAAEIDELRERMDLGDIRHFTRGFVCHNELVFYIRGSTSAAAVGRRAASGVSAHLPL